MGRLPHSHFSLSFFPLSYLSRKSPRNIKTLFASYPLLFLFVPALTTPFVRSFFVGRLFRQPSSASSPDLSLSFIGRPFVLFHWNSKPGNLRRPTVRSSSISPFVEIGPTVHLARWKRRSTFPTNLFFFFLFFVFFRYFSFFRSEKFYVLGFFFFSLFFWYIFCFYYIFL